ncbi:MAG: spore germination protein [Clostridiales bacterium]|nr:spore germination protein [Clostridiales bacterium]
MTKYKVGKISGANLFSLLFICNVLVIFTKSTISLKGQFSSDIFISLIIAFGVVALAGIPVNIAAKRAQRLINNKYINILYALYFLYIGAVGVGRFALFASTELDYQTKAWVFALLIIAAGAYCAYLGLEALSRFSSVVFILTVVGIAAMLLFSIREFSLINLFPFTKNSAADIISNALDFASDTGEIVITAAIAPKVNGKVQKPFYFSVLLSFIMSSLLVLGAMGVMGDAAALNSYPFFQLSQLARMNESVRLDSLYTAFWILTVLIKTALLLYCAGELLPIKKKGLSFTCAGIIMLLISLTITSTDSFFVINLYSRFIPFVVFAFALPLFLLLSFKKNKGDELLEKL